MVLSDAEQLGKYQILDELGRGGFATVYRALDTTLDREVALKVLDPLFLRDGAWVARFRREAKSAARLVHPHIVTIYEIAEADGRLYIAMQLARGGSVAHRIAAEGRLSWDETLTILQPVCEALTYAHAQGLVHRDLKPANILLDSELGPLIVDFGFARLMGDNSMSLSASGGIVGTPAYIAPEIWELDSAEAPADIYALGCIVYEMLTGRVLFGGRTPMQVMRAHDYGPQFPDAWPDGVPAGISRLFARALAKASSDRYASPHALWEALATEAVEATRRQQEAEETALRQHEAETEAKPQVGVAEMAQRQRESEKTTSEAMSTLGLAPGVEMAFVEVPAGQFLMGSDRRKYPRAGKSEQPQHKVTLDGYWIARTPVTNAQYAAFVAATGHRMPKHWMNDRPPEGKEPHPVVNVSWEDAVQFCRWASRLGHGEVRLPTEAEWEKAARGTDGRLFPWGNEEPDVHRGNFGAHEWDTTAVERYSPQGDSPYGCADMAGNVHEWCWDWYAANTYRTTSNRNPQGPEAGYSRVLRGGGWFDTWNDLRVAGRHHSGPVDLDDHVGFRCARGAPGN